MTTTLISTDEAGYGPNLGPLLIAGTCWTVADAESDMFEQLRSGVCRQVDPNTARMLIADSKQVYRAGSLAALEEPVLGVIQTLAGRLPNSIEDLIQLCSPALFDGHVERMKQQGWLEGRGFSFPRAGKLETIGRLSEVFRKACQQALVQLRAVECKVLFSDHFNQELQGEGNKANLLSAQTLDLARLLLEQSERRNPVRIDCDKHGGRSRYAALVQHHFDADYVSVIRESANVSEYEFQQQGRSIRIRFSARGESVLPTALSSMIAKYLREIFMQAWNQFWTKELPELRPTQGYPQDAKRFLRDIESARVRLGIALESIWRQR